MTVTMALQDCGIVTAGILNVLYGHTDIKICCNGNYKTKYL